MWLRVACGGPDVSRDEWRHLLFCIHVYIGLCVRICLHNNIIYVYDIDMYTLYFTI